MILKHQHFDLVNKVVLERVVFNPPLKAKDIMQDEACLLYAVNGNSTLFGGSERHALQSEEAIFMKCGSYLNHWQKSSDDKPYEAVAIHLYPEVLKRVYNNEIPAYLKNKRPSDPKLFQKVGSEEVIKNYIDSILFYFENPELVNEDLIILKIRELILLLYNLNNRNIRNILQDLFNPEKLEFREVINSNIFENLSLEDFAHITHLSLSSFKRKFKDTFDESPARYIKSRRLEKAADLLKVSSNRISDICFDCGFNDLGHFSKSFLIKYNDSPSEYRKKHLTQINQ